MQAYAAAPRAGATQRSREQADNDERRNARLWEAFLQRGRAAAAANGERQGADPGDNEGPQPQQPQPRQQQQQGPRPGTAEQRHAEQQQQRACGGATDFCDAGRGGPEQQSEGRTEQQQAGQQQPQQAHQPQKQQPQGDGGRSQARQKERGDTQLELKVASFNVRSLLGGPRKQRQEHTGLSAAKALRQEAAGRRWLLVGLQEARTQTQQLRTAEYHACASGADQGHGGLDTWVVTPKLQLEWWGRVVIHPGSMAVVEATPRMRITTHSTDWGRLLVFNGHAPTSATAQAERDSFW